MGNKQGRIRQLLPSEAKGIQRNLLKKKKKSIAQKTRDGITNNVISIDTEDREMIKQTRDAKLNFDRERYDYQKIVETEKMKIEKERLELDKSTMRLKLSQIETQVTFEKNKTLLLKLDILEKRETLKKKFPNLTDDYFEKNFPFSA